MLLVHLSDIHLGRRQYGLEARARDYEEAFMRAVGKVIELKESKGVEAVLVTGDIFDNPRPAPSTYLTAIRGFTMLKNAGLRILAIRGNHDASATNPVDNPIQVLSSSGLLEYLDGGFVDLGGVRVIGVGCVPRDRQERAVKAVRGLMGRGLNIVMMHQYIEGTPYKYPMPNIDYYSISQADLPKTPHYALGHIHEHALAHPTLSAVYAGSLEIWDSGEFETYVIDSGRLTRVKGQDPKGFLILEADESKGRVKVTPVQLEAGRRMIRLIVNVSGEDPRHFREAASEASQLNIGGSYIQVDVVGKLAEGFSTRDYDFTRFFKSIFSNALGVNVRIDVTKPTSAASRINVRGLGEMLEVALGKAIGDRAILNALIAAVDLIDQGREDEAEALLMKVIRNGGVDKP